MSNVMKNFLSTVNDSARYICPLCSDQRKKKNERTLSVSVENDGIKYTCWHCAEAGGYTFKQLRGEVSRPASPPAPRAISVPKSSDSTNVENYLASRGINYSLVKDKFKVVHGRITDKFSGESVDHAWVEMDGVVFDDQTKHTKPDGMPKDVYYDLYQPEVYDEYTAEESMINCVKSGHQGPWK